MAKDFNKGFDVIDSMINDEPTEGSKKTAQKKKATEKTLPVSFRMKEDTVKTLKKIAFYKQLSLKDTLEAIVLEYAKGLNLPKTEDEETKEG